jgi:uncharacterized protein YdhG (YjbR/CyaY superfamily)
MKTTEEYIAMQQEPFRSKLEELKAIIMSAVPTATHQISYQIPCFKYHGFFIGIGVTKKHVSLYSMNTNLENDMGLTPGTLDFHGTKSTVHFPANKPLPKALIKKIVLFKAKQNEEKAKIHLSKGK